MIDQSTALDSHLSSTLERLREQSEERRAALRRVRPHAKQAPVIFNPSNYLARSHGTFEHSMSTLGEEEARGKACDGSASPSSITDLLFLPRPEPADKWTRAERTGKTDVLSAALDRLHTNDELRAEAEAIASSELLMNETAYDATPTPPEDHIGRRTAHHSWDLEMMVQMVERGDPTQTSGELDLLDILEAMEDDDGANGDEPPANDSRSVLPLLGTSRGRLPPITEDRP